MKALIILPTYNESLNIKKIVKEIFEVENNINILVVDDNSPDKTYEIVENLIKKSYKDKLFLLKREKKDGLKNAYFAGFRWALKRDYEVIFEMDADFSHHPTHIPAFLEAIKENDLVLGSRYIKNGKTKGWGVIRKIISIGGNLYAKIILSSKINDLTGGFKCFKREILEKIDFDKIKSNGYGFQVEMTYRICLMGFKVKEVPIVFEDRQHGSSKMSNNIFWEAFVKVLLLRLKKNQIKKGLY